jgi:hypothetical protein
MSAAEDLKARDDVTADRGRPVAWDATSGEPIAWLRVGEVTAGTLHSAGGPIAYTHLLTLQEAVATYGPIAEWVVGPIGGFRRVCLGETVFSSHHLAAGVDVDALPRGVVTVDDPDLEWPCPQCGSAPGQRCSGGVSKHRVRRAHGAEYRALRDEIDTLRDTVKRLRDQNALLAAKLDAEDKRKRVPVCNRPTRSTGKPCQADAILFPVPVESCRLHLTTEEREILAAAERRDL